MSTPKTKTLLCAIILSRVTKTMSPHRIRHLIESNPTLKQRIINALQAGGTEALREFLSHPAGNFVIGALADCVRD